MRKFILNDTVKNSEMVLPVTPPSFDISYGINVETINIHTLGDMVLPGYSTLPTIKVVCMFPAKKYSFNQPGTRIDPYGYYINKLKKWCGNHTILRFVVSDTSVNEQVIITDISYGEKDGTGDVYATITLSGYKNLSAVQKDKTGNRSRSTDKGKSSMVNYIIKPGDTMWAICRKYYGSASYCKKLAAYNDIKNVNLIYAGKTLEIPDKDLL